MNEYNDALNKGILPVMRGVQLTQDDQLRREVITELMCNFRLIKKDIENKYSLVFDDYFEEALGGLKSFEDDNLIKLNTDSLTITPEGRLLIRNIAMNFDAYLMSKSENKPQFSRTV